MNSATFSAIRKSFLHEILRHATPIMRPVLTFRESFLREMLLSYRSAKVFSLENFPLYGTCIIAGMYYINTLIIDIGQIIINFINLIIQFFYHHESCKHA